MERLLASMANLSPDLIAITSPARRVLFWSKGAKAATGWSVQEAKDGDFFELLHITGQTVLEKAFRRVATGGEWEGVTSTLGRSCSPSPCGRGGWG